VQDELNALTQQKNDIRSLARQENDLLSGMSDEDLVTYFDREKTFGWLPTMQWALSKYGSQ
jgi:hypothetical protein